VELKNFQISHKTFFNSGAWKCAIFAKGGIEIRHDYREKYLKSQGSKFLTSS